VVSIGVPVYNGERFVGEALTSLLAQDFGDIEVVVSDNASTDGTEEICRDLAASDRRLRYVRHPVNRGGAANFNAAFHLRHPDARYFKWAASDDVHDPAYLSTVLEALRSDASAVVGHCRTSDIDEQGQPLREWGDQGLPVGDADPAVRFGALSRLNYQCFAIFGVVPVAVLASTRLLGYYAESDRVLLAELSLRGRFAEVPETLFHRRQHGARSVRLYPTARDRVAWFNPDLVGRPVFPEWRLGRGYLGAVLEAPLAPADRLRCLGQMGVWTVSHAPHLARNVARTAAEVVGGRTPLRRSASVAA
jgi:glycosyltransferase involved in cell wall biosynthesis